MMFAWTMQVSSYSYPCVYDWYAVMWANKTQGEKMWQPVVDHLAPHLLVQPARPEFVVATLLSPQVSYFSEFRVIVVNKNHGQNYENKTRFVIKTNYPLSAWPAAYFTTHHLLLRLPSFSHYNAPSVRPHLRAEPGSVSVIISLSSDHFKKLAVSGVWRRNVIAC